MGHYSSARTPCERKRLSGSLKAVAVEIRFIRAIVTRDWLIQLQRNLHCTRKALLDTYISSFRSVAYVFENQTCKFPISWKLNYPYSKYWLNHCVPLGEAITNMSLFTRFRQSGADIWLIKGSILRCTGKVTMWFREREANVTDKTSWISLIKYLGKKAKMFGWNLQQ